MKKTVLSIALVLSALSGFAQSANYRAFKVDLTTGYSRPTAVSGGSVSGGVNFSIEPKYNVTDQIAIGLKFEGAVLASADEALTGLSLLTVMQATQLTGEYYFGESKVRPYAGVAIGMYKQILFNTEGGLDQIGTSTSRFGLAPRAGLQFGHFRLGVEYNLVSNANYFSVKLGTTIGGGRK